MYNPLKNWLYEYLELYRNAKKTQFLRKFHFQYSSLKDSDYIQLCEILIENWYATNNNDVGQYSTPIQIGLKSVGKLQTQRPNKVPIQYREKLNGLLEDRKKME